MTRQARQLEYREANRRAILDAALDQFVAQGYAQASVRSIAAKAGFSPASIYFYFASKDDIFFALAEEGFRLLGGTSMACATASTDPIENVRAAIWRVYEFSKEHPEYFALVFLDRHVPRIGREYEGFAFISEMKARMHGQIERAIANGDLPPTLAPQEVMRLLSAPVLGIAAMRLSNRLGPGEDADALARAALDLVLTGLRHHAPALHP